MGKVITKVVETVKASRGFQVKRANKDALASAKAVMVAYLTGAAKGKYPTVAFNPADRDRPQNFACMLAVGFVQGWTSDADGSDKVSLIQQAYGLRVAGRKLGFPAMSSTSAIVREKTMRGLAADWIGRANAKGTFFLVSTKPSERVAVRAMRGTKGTSATTKGKGAKGATKGARIDAQARSERSDGKVVVTVDKALRNAAKAAERNAQRAANRTKQAAQGKTDLSAKDVAQADIAKAEQP